MRNSLIAVLVLAVVAFGSPVFANNNSGSNNNTTEVVTTNVNNTNNSSKNHANANSNSNSSVKNSGNSESNSSVKNSGNSNVKTSQKQGQIQAQGQETSQANGQNTSIGGDKNTVYANSWPGANAEVGTSNGTASSVFGSLAIADTEKYKMIEQIVQTLASEVNAGVISKDDAMAYVAMLNKKMVLSVKTKRICGIGPETSGKNLLNLLGLLSWDSFYKDGDKQGGDLRQLAAAIEESDRTEVTNADVTTGTQTNSTN